MMTAAGPGFTPGAPSFFHRSSVSGEISAPVDQITSVTLTLRQESGLHVTLPLDPKEHLVDTSDVLTTLLIVWNMSEAAPVPFESLNYRWQADTQDGLHSVAASEIMLEDTARVWQTPRTAVILRCIMPTARSIRRKSVARSAIPLWALAAVSLRLRSGSLRQKAKEP
jgi:hypothetical protein